MIDSELTLEGLWRNSTLDDYPLLGIIGFRFSTLFVFHNNAQQPLTWLLRQPGAQEINVARL